MMDLILEAWVSGSIEKAKARWILGAGNSWQPGEKLKLLFAGYNGTRNMGSDVRVEEMLRQMRHILGAERVDFTAMTFDFERSRGYFENTAQVRLPDIFPPFLSEEVPRHHGVVACEGSMFKSKFANALTTMMIGSLGIAAAQNKLSVGYGGEAGQMDPLLAKMCGRYCRNSLVITRNEESRTRLRELGVPTELGTDTAWTFEPRPAEYGQNVLRQVGWDGHTPVLVVCPINPFEWPVKASLLKTTLRATTGATKGVTIAGPTSTIRARPLIAPTSTISLPSPTRWPRSANSGMYSSFWPRQSGWIRARQAASRSCSAACPSSLPTSTTCTNW